MQQVNRDLDRNGNMQEPATTVHSAAVSTFIISKLATVEEGLTKMVENSRPNLAPTTSSTAQAYCTTNTL